MLNVYITVDVEVWCDDWQHIDAQFPSAFRRYIYGETRQGQYALPMTLKMLGDSGLEAVFFVEPLFATRFGVDYLREIVALIQNAGQSIELHLHPEWVDEALDPLLEQKGPKRRMMSDFSLAEQTRLVAAGSTLLREAGVPETCAFRAGSYGANVDTLRALKSNDILIDSSYNACMGGRESGIANGMVLWQPMQVEGICEYPITVFSDYPGHLRPAQVGATSFREMRRLLWAALEAGVDSVVIVTHSFEMLSAGRDAVDRVVAQRFSELCGFLDRHRDQFRTRQFTRPTRDLTLTALDPPATSIWLTAGRMIEQAARAALR